MEKILDKIFKKRAIHDCDGSIYMHRWFVFRTKWIALFIHKFVRSDYERALHDHPWNFLVIPIWRGYIEHSDKHTDCDMECETKKGTRAHCVFPRVRRVYPIIGTRFRRAEFRHRVELIQEEARISKMSEHDREICKGILLPLPAWSLFFRFRKRRVWGFWLATGWQAWNKWWQDNCGEVEEEKY